MTGPVDPHPARGPEDHCITCGDTAVPMRIVEVDRDRQLALCDDGEGGRSTVETGLVEPVAVGESLLVHAGTALANLGPDAPVAA